jgi:hypothetical protein
MRFAIGRLYDVSIGETARRKRPTALRADPEASGTSRTKGQQPVSDNKLTAEQVDQQIAARVEQLKSLAVAPTVEPVDEEVARRVERLQTQADVLNELNTRIETAKHTGDLFPAS